MNILLERIAERITDGEILKAKNVTCGPYQTACGPRQYATFDRRGAGEVHDDAVSAAALFVDWIGVPAVLRALHAEYL